MRPTRHVFGGLLVLCLVTPDRGARALGVQESAAQDPVDVVLSAVPTPPIAFVGITPCRLVDTRTGSGFIGPFGPPSLGGQPPGGTFRFFPVAGQCGIPASAQALSANMAVTNTTGNGFISVWPGDGAQPVPLVASMNFSTGQTIANAVLVPLGNGGINVFARVTTDLIIDVNGYFDTGAAGPTGATGAEGQAGPMGATGANGAPGATGPIGPTGGPGPAGSQGATGPAGTQGVAGAQGAVGPTGPNGTNGVNGAAGANGATGPAGLNGVAGAAGPAGPQGPTGPAGSGVIVNSASNANTYFTALFACVNYTNGQVTIAAPGPGTVLVTANAQVTYFHTAGTADRFQLAIGSTPTTDCDTNTDNVTVQTPPEFPSFSGAINTWTVTRAFNVAAAGNYTFYLNGWKLIGGVAPGTQDNFKYAAMHAVFYR